MSECKNCNGTKRAMYFSEQAWADDERVCHVCRDPAPTPQQPFAWIVGSVDRKVAHTVYFSEAAATRHYERTKGILHDWVKVEPIYAAPQSTAMNAKPVTDTSRIDYKNPILKAIEDVRAGTPSPDTVREAIWPLNDRQLWEEGCITRAQTKHWTDEDISKHAAGMRKTVLFLFDRLDKFAALSSAPVAGAEAIKPNSVSQIGANVSVEFVMPDNSAATALRMRIAFGIRDGKVSLHVPFPRQEGNTHE